MSQIELAINTDNKPASFPSVDTIIQRCSTRSILASDIRGFLLVDESGGSDGAPGVWVKFGMSITMAEARTQQYVAQSLNDKAGAAVRIPCVYLAFESDGLGYIVSEYIDGTICNNADAALVAAAVQSLITVQGPTAEPGPIGGGPIDHGFFVECKSSITYRSVDELEAHINGILRTLGYSERVSFRAEVETGGLPLCPCDMNRSNFMKDGQGRIVAVDFGASCFLPPSFFSFALYHGDNFTRLIARRLKHSSSAQLNALMTASFALVPFNTNNIGIPPNLK